MTKVDESGVVPPLDDAALTRLSAALDRKNVVAASIPPAIRDGRLLVEREPRLRVRFETASILEYLDTAPLRRMLAEATRRRLAEDSFGRP